MITRTNRFVAAAIRRALFQIAALTAAILQPSTISASSAVGGQIVTQKIKFGRKEERALRVTVELNEEQHVFEFAAPGER